MDKPQTVVPDDNVVGIFWQVARETVGWGSLEALLGQRDISSLRPPAVAYDDVAEEATAIAQAIRGGRKTQMTTPRGEYAADGSDLPHIGDLLIVCDGAGIPLALTRNVVVREEDDLVIEEFVTMYPAQKRPDAAKK